MRWPHRPPGLRWPLPATGWRGEPRHGPFSWPWRVAWVDVAWAVFSLANLAAIVIFSHWETVPFHFIWISLTLLYGFRVWSTRPTAWVLARGHGHHGRRDRLGRLPAAPRRWTS